MKPDCEETVSGQLNTVDRFSDLPDFILHHIISFLCTEEAYRTSILSKRWAHIMATTPFLEIHYHCETTDMYWPSNEDSARLLEYIDTRMQKYSNEKLRIRTLTLGLPNYDEELGSDFEELGSDFEELGFTLGDFGCKIEELELTRRVLELSCKVDEWLRIAAFNHVAKLDIDGPINLPDILFSAKSLEQLDCRNVKIPYYSKAIDLVSLKTLKLENIVVEDRMLNHIISSCLGDRWPVISKPGLLRNLKRLEIDSVDITNEAFGRLLPELLSLETLKLGCCNELSIIRISNIHLKVICFDNCSGLLDVCIDAPSLKFFIYRWEFNFPSITVSTLASCVVSLHFPPCYLDTGAFWKMKKLWTGISSCDALKVLVIEESNKGEFESIKFDKEELGNDNLGPPCEIREVKLNLFSGILPKSSIAAFLDGLFWTCHPDIISFPVCVRDPNLTIEPLMSELQKLAKCWSHPLKQVEVDGSNCSNLLRSIKFRLHW